jgi:hypothetical protein
VPYYFNIFKILEPFSLIHILDNEVTAKNIDYSIQIGSKDDPLQPIMDVVLYSIKNDNENLMKNGIECIYLKFKYLLDNMDLGIIEEKEFAGMVSDHIKRISIFLINNKKFYATEFMIITLREMGQAAINQKKENVIKKFIASLEAIGLESIKFRENRLIHLTTISLGKIGTQSSEWGLKNSSHEAVVSLGRIGKESTNKDIEDAYMVSICHERIVMKAIEKHMQNVVYDVLLSLGAMAAIAAERENKMVLEQIIFNFQEIGRKLKESEMNNFAVIIKYIMISIKNYPISRKMPEIESKCDKTISLLNIS